MPFSDPAEILNSLTAPRNLSTDERHNLVTEILNKSSVMPARGQGKDKNQYKKAAGAYISQLLKYKDQKTWSNEDHADNDDKRLDRREADWTALKYEMDVKQATYENLPTVPSGSRIAPGLYRRRGPRHGIQVVLEHQTGYLDSLNLAQLTELRKKIRRQKDNSAAQGSLENTISVVGYKKLRDAVYTRRKREIKIKQRYHPPAQLLWQWASRIWSQVKKRSKPTGSQPIIGKEASGTDDKYHWSSASKKKMRREEMEIMEKYQIHVAKSSEIEEPGNKPFLRTATKLKRNDRKEAKTTHAYEHKEDEEMTLKDNALMFELYQNRVKWDRRGAQRKNEQKESESKAKPEAAGEAEQKHNENRDGVEVDAKENKESVEPSSEDIQKELRRVMLEIMPLKLALLADAGNLTTDERRQRVTEILNKSSVGQPIGEYISQLFKQLKAIEHPDEKIWSQQDLQQLKDRRNDYLGAKSNLPKAVSLKESKESDGPRALILLGPGHELEKITHGVVKGDGINPVSLSRLSGEPGIVIVGAHGKVINRNTKHRPTDNESGMIRLGDGGEEISDVIAQIHQKTRTKNIAIFACYVGSGVDNTSRTSVVKNLEVGTKILLFGSSKYMTHASKDDFIINKLAEFYEENEHASIEEFFIESTMRDVQTVMFSKVIRDDDGRKRLVTVKSVAPKKPENIGSVRNYLANGEAIIPRRKDDEAHRHFAAALQAVLKQKSLLLTNQQIQEYEEKALIEASSRGVTSRVEAWLNKGVSVNALHHSFTPLIAAASSGQAGVINILVANGADVNQTDKYGNTALHFVAAKGQAGVINILVANGVDVNQTTKDGYTALYFARKQHHADVIKELVANGASERREKIRRILKWVGIALVVLGVLLGVLL